MAKFEAARSALSMSKDTRLSNAVSNVKRQATSTTANTNAPADGPSPILSPAAQRQFSSDALVDELVAIADKVTTFEQLLANLPEPILQNGDCLGMWFTKVETAGETGTPTPVIDADEDTLGTLEADTIEQLTQAAAASSRLFYEQVETGTPYQLVASPVVSSDKTVGVLTGCFSLQSQAATRHHWLMMMATQAISTWLQTTEIKRAKSRVASLNDAIDLVKRLDETGSVTETGLIIVNHMRRLFEVDQVAFSHVDSAGNNRLIAISDVEQLEIGSEVSKTAQAACDRAVQLSKTLVYPATEPNGEQSKMLEQYCRSNRLGGSVCVPLSLNGEKPNGAILIAGTADQVCQPKFLENVSHVVGLLSGHLNTVLKANRSAMSLAKAGVARSLKNSMGKKVLLLLGVVALAMLIPVPYRIGADCQLEPVVRRFVAAPYDGILENSLVESGAVVEQDQLLARMDGRALRIELSGVQADLAAAKKRRDSALATGDVAQSHIARSEMKRHQSQIELLEGRLQNLEIRSPIKGVVVSGDLEKAQGAPLNVGQSLFEVGPLDEMVAEIRIPESEIRFVKPDARVNIKLNAYPFKTFTGKVRRVHTRSEIVEDSNVFIAEVIMDNSDMQLRPGMQGTSKIESGLSPLGWNLFHNAWEKARYWLVW